MTNRSDDRPRGRTPPRRTPLSGAPRSRAPVDALLRLPTAALVACLCLLLAACTGTQEPRPATLLLVGVETGGVGNLLLVEDVTATAPVGSPRLVVVPGSARALQGNAVSLDLEDRNVQRPAAWVLTRSVSGVGGVPQVTSYLQRFAVADIDPAAPSAFAEDASARLLLSEPGGTGLLDGLSLTSPFSCPSAVQVNRTGTMAVVLDDPSRCGSSDHPELWLLATDGSEVRLLQGTNDVLGLPAYLDQRPDTELVYFLVDAINSAHVYVAEVDGASSHRITDLTVPESPSNLVDLAGAGDALIALAGQDILSLSLSTPAPATRVPTRPGSDALVTDLSGAITELLVLDTSGTAMHTDPTDSPFDSTTARAVAGVLDPVTRFGYGVAEGGIVIYDLLTGGDSGEPFRVHTEPIASLTLPLARPPTLPGADGSRVSVISWVRAAP